MTARTSTVIAILVIVLLALCTACVCVSAGVLVYFGRNKPDGPVQNPLGSSWGTYGDPEPEGTVTPPTVEQPPDEATETLHALEIGRASCRERV